MTFYSLWEIIIQINRGIYWLSRAGHMSNIDVYNNTVFKVLFPAKPAP